VLDGYAQEGVVHSGKIQFHLISTSGVIFYAGRQWVGGRNP
jgi:hypothetical protein